MILFNYGCVYTSLCGSSSSQAGPTALFGRVDSATLASPQQRHNPLCLLLPVPSILLFPKIRRNPAAKSRPLRAADCRGFPVDLHQALVTWIGASGITLRVNPRAEAASLRASGVVGLVQFRRIELSGRVVGCSWRRGGDWGILEGCGIGVARLL